MANVYEGLTVGQKLAKARLQFLNSKVSKSGKNMKLEFQYFELDDIVPTGLRIFARVGLISETKIDETSAIMKIYNADNMTGETMDFVIPYREMEKIISHAGNVVTNNLQALGASITYLRRYLWMLVLEVTEPDSVDPNLGNEEETEPEVVPAKRSRKPKAPATIQERADAKKELTSVNENATEEQIGKLKSLCKELIAKDETQEDFVQKIALKTDAFTNITAAVCDELISNIDQLIKAYGEESNDSSN